MSRPRSIPVIDDAARDARGWLLALDLYVEPFVAFPHHDLPPWVVACWLVARHELGPKASTTEGRALRQHWRLFLVLLTRDHGTRAAIESAARLGTPEATEAYTAPLFARFVEVTTAAPVSSRVRRLQALRARRLDGRAGRPGDAAIEAEVRKVKPPVKKGGPHRRSPKS